MKNMKITPRHTVIKLLKPGGNKEKNLKSNLRQKTHYVQKNRDINDNTFSTKTMQARKTVGPCP